MNYIKHIIVTALLIGSVFSSYAQYAGQYIGFNPTLESVPHPEFFLENPGITCTTAPTCVTNAMSWDNPGGVQTLEGYSYVLTSDLILSNSHRVSLVMGSAPDDPNGVTTITPFNGTYEKGINIDRLWVGRKASATSEPYPYCKINTTYDTLIVDEVWVPAGATLEIEGQFPLIVRKELHNKGTIICDENLLLPVYTEGDITPKGFHAMFEQKGEVIGRYSSEILINERPEFLNWDWVTENFGGDADFLDSLTMLGLDPAIISQYIDIYNQHFLTDEEPWFLYMLQADVTNTGDHRAVMTGSPVKGVRFGPHYEDYERVAIYKDSYKRKPALWSWPAEMKLPNDVNILSELADEIAAIYVTRAGLNKMHNELAGGAPPYYSSGDASDASYIAGTFEDSYSTGEWESVSFMKPDTTNYYNGFSTAAQYKYPPDPEDPYNPDWWPKTYMYQDPGYPDNVPLPWADGDLVPEATARRSFRDWTSSWLSNDGGGGYTFIEPDVNEIFVTMEYCRTADLQFYIPEDPWISPRLWLQDLPAQGLDSTWVISPRGCADTLYATFGLFEMAQQTGDIFWNFSLLNDPTSDDIWNYTELLEKDTLVAGYDSIYDYKWYYRNDEAAAQSIFNGFDFWFGQRPAARFNSLTSIGSWWFDIEVNGSNKNKIWEHPQHMFTYDTAGSFYPTLYQNTTIDWDSIQNLNDYWNLMYLQPKLDTWIDDVPELAYLADYYPDSTRMQPVRTDVNQDWWGAAWMLADYSTPMPYPVPFITRVMWAENTEMIERYTGYSWMNTLDAYNHPDMQYHPQDFTNEPLIPNLPPNNSGDHMLKFHLPTATDWVYTYAPNGLLYEANTWAECISQNDTTYCIDYFNGNNLYFDEWGISTYQDLTDLVNVYYDENDFEQALDFNNYTARRNRHGALANPLQGYLDLDAVADKYFEDYPESNHLEFAWWNDFTPTGTSNTNPGNVYNTRKNYWRRKYHRYGEEIVSDEIEYFISLLADQFIAQNGQGFNAELTNVILSFLGNNDPNVSGFEPGSPMWNWLISAPVNPNGYVGFGQYALPGAGIHARNSSGSPVELTITADMGIYDFEWPLSTGNEVYLGSFGPGDTGTGYGGRAANAQPVSSSITADHSTVIVLDWLNDSTYMPWIFLHHRFLDDASNGSEQIFEDNHNLFPNFPWVYTDSTKVRPSNYVEEYGPHNQAPLYVNIPQPLDSNGAWCFIPTLFQDTGSVWYDPSIGQIYTRLGLELYDSNGQINVIRYLDKGDTLWVRHDDPYDWPIKGKLYFTNLIGDINGDGVVTISDIIDMLQNFNMCIEDAPNVAYFDVNGDGCLTTSDLLIVFANLGQTIGNSIGDFSGSIFDFVPDGPERFAGNKWDHPDWPTAEIENFFLTELSSIYEFGDISTTKILSMFGETIQVFNSNSQLIASGTNSVQLPLTGGPYMIVTDRSVSHYDVNEVPNVVATTTSSGSISDADGGRTAILPSRAATYPLGTAQFWTDFYSDIKAIDYVADGDLNDAPTLAQIYYGINSGPNANQVNPNNAKIGGLIDIFGAGDATHGYTFDSTTGAHTDERFNATAKAYTTFKQNRDDPIFEPTMVPLAYALPRVDNRHKEGRTLLGFETNSELNRQVEDGIAENFDVFSELSGRREPGVTEWGGDIKKYYDVPLHNGVMAMCDFMTLKDYFQFKMYGVSPKFGQVNAGSTIPRTTTESFGTVYNTGAVEGVPNGPGIGYAPSRCNNLADYTTNIVVPFITANIGNTVVLPQDPTPVTQDGIQRNIDDAGHYNWFGNSAAFVHNGSFGPLVYDFNMSGTWDAEDLTIWNNLVAIWDAAGITQGDTPYADASYYRPATDALNEVVNVLQDYEDGGKYHASWNFNKWFDATATATPLDYVNNWYACLNQPEWNLNLLNPTVLTTTAFAGESVQEDYFFYNNTRTGFNPDFLTPTTLNNYGKVAINDYVPEADLYEYQVVPSSNYFPVTMYWHP